jgi:hypothetical protein
MVVRRDEGGGGDERWPRKPHRDNLPLRTIVALAKPKKEARQMLTDEQYWDLVGYIKRLYDFGNPKATSDLQIRRLEEFWELRVKGGFIRNINLRIYFAYLQERNEIVILMSYKKEEDHQVSSHIRIILEDRLEDYLLGLSQGASVYPHRVI